MNSLCELKRQYRNGRVIPFIGAGVSMSVKWQEGDKQVHGPSWSELADKASELLGFSDPRLLRTRGNGLQILEYFKLKNADEVAKLTNWLSKAMDPPDEALQSSVIHSSLGKLDKCSIFYTTNYDNFLERAFRLAGRKCRTIAVEAEMGLLGSETEIVKFHGDFDHPEQIVLTESDYEKRLSLLGHLDDRLKADLLGRVLLFIGYSFRDPNVSYLFRLFTDRSHGVTGCLPGDRAYIIVPDPSDFERRLFQARHIGVLPICERTREADIAELLNHLRG